MTTSERVTMKSGKSEHNTIQIEYYSAGVKDTMKPSASPYLLNQIEKIIKFGDLKKEDKILEVGCGMGRYTLSLAEQGFNITGIDLTKFLLERLDDYNGGRFDIKLYNSDIINAPEELNNSFDKIIGFFALHHFHDIEECYKSMYRLLKPGGSIIFLEPNAFNPLYYLQILITPKMTWEGDKGIVNMRRSRIFKHMKNAGLKELKVKRFGFLPPFLYNMKTGPFFDKLFSSFPLWKKLLPFQMFKGNKHA